MVVFLGSDRLRWASATSPIALDQTAHQGLDEPRYVVLAKLEGGYAGVLPPDREDHELALVMPRHSHRAALIAGVEEYLAARG
jgi:hypothetical protein